MKHVKPLLIGFISMFTIWVLLAGTSVQELIFGGIAALFVTMLFRQKLTMLQDIKFNPKSIIFMVGYFFVFFWELFKSNFDVALRVISPKLPINPGIVKVRTGLKSPLGRSFLANSITLTPGTLTVEMRDEYFYIHWIDVTSDDIEGSTQKIVTKFEKYLEVIFG